MFVKGGGGPRERGKNIGLGPKKGLLEDQAHLWQISTADKDEKNFYT
jgi:hypothetical protein